MQTLFSGKGEGLSQTGLVPKHTEEWIYNRRQIKEQLGRVRSEWLKELKREEYRKKNNEVEASAWAGKKRMIDGIAEEAESTARDNNIGDLYMYLLIDKADSSGKYKHSDSCQQAWEAVNHWKGNPWKMEGALWRGAQWRFCRKWVTRWHCTDATIIEINQDQIMPQQALNDWPQGKQWVLFPLNLQSSPRWSWGEL